MYRNSNYTQQFAKTPRGPRHELAIDDVSQTSATSTWYYRVNVSVYEEVLVSTFIDEDASSSDDDRSSGASLLTTDVEHYSILRRYSDFLHLYEKIRAAVIITEGDASAMPPFPAKESISPALLGLVRRVSSEVLLEERRIKFEVLLQWIENHAVARDCLAFVNFLEIHPSHTTATLA